MPFIFSLLTIALMIFALIDIIMRRDDQVKFLPKMVWIIIVILLPLIGSVLWFALGREYSGEGVRLPRMQRAAPPAPASVPAWAPPATPVDTRTTEQQLADLDREIEEWRLREEIAKRQKDQDQAGEGRV